MPVQICVHNPAVYFLTASTNSKLSRSILYAFIHLVFALHFRVKMFGGSNALHYLPYLHHFVPHYIVVKPQPVTLDTAACTYNKISILSLQTYTSLTGKCFPASESCVKIMLTN
jgi:hypothetical protein